MTEDTQQKEDLLQSTSQSIVADIESKKKASKVKAGKTSAQLSQEANINKAEALPFGEGTTDTEIEKKKRLQKIQATKTMKSKLTTRGQIGTVGNKLPQPRDIENE